MAGGSYGACVCMDSILCVGLGNIGALTGPALEKPLQTSIDHVELDGPVE